MLLPAVVLRQVFVFSICFLVTYRLSGLVCDQSGQGARALITHTHPRPHARPGALDTASLNLRAQLHTALPMQSPAVSRSRHLTVCDGVSVCGHASVSGRHASGLCIEYSFPIDPPPVGPRLDEVSAHTPAPACTPRCFGPRNHTPESPALPMQSPAVSRSRHLTVCGGVSVCGHASVSGRHTSGLCIEYSFPINTPPVGPRLDEVSAHTPAPACLSLIHI